MWKPAAVAMVSLIVAGCSTDRLADGQPSMATATYDCGQDGVVSARFDNRADTLTLAMAGRAVRLTQQRAASGIWYIGDRTELRGKGRVATITLPGAAPMECMARSLTGLFWYCPMPAGNGAEMRQPSVKPLYCHAWFIWMTGTVADRQHIPISDPKVHFALQPTAGLWL